VMDATLKGPDACSPSCALLATPRITQADHVLFVADGAAWIWKRVPLLVQALGLVLRFINDVQVAASSRQLRWRLRGPFCGASIFARRVISLVRSNFTEKALDCGWKVLRTGQPEPESFQVAKVIGCQDLRWMIEK